MSNVKPPMAAIRLSCIALVLFLAACDRTAPPVTSSRSVEVPPPPDVGDVGRFLGCRAEPRRALTERERCELKALASECTATADCYTSCISSPDGTSVGGGCEHVCSSVQPGNRPDTSACNNVPGVSGFKHQRLGPNNSSKPTPLRGAA